MKTILAILCGISIGCSTTTTKPDGTVVVMGPDGKATAIIAGDITQIADDIIVLKQSKSQQLHPPLSVSVK